MCLASSYDADQDQSYRPMPPKGGWTLLEAADALCPQAAQLFREGGSRLEEAMQAELSDPETSLMFPRQWLSPRLVNALCLRPDLQITGRKLADGIHAERVRVPHDLLLAAQVGFNGGQSNEGVWLYLNVATNHARFTFDLPSNARRTDVLAAARIEATEAEVPSADLPTSSVVAFPDLCSAIRPEYTEQACRAWFMLRVATWPKSEDPPTAEQCLAAARAYFAGSLPRDPFYALRHKCVPASWRQPGKRRRPKRS